MTDLLTELQWANVRLEAIDRFNGETPRPDTEAAIIDVFEIAPKAVMRAIDEVAGAVERGEARSGWAVLRSRLDQRSQPVRDVAVRGVDERAKRISQAEQWMRTTGLHFDRQAEVEDEVFGDRGLLREWRDDAALRSRMFSAWAEARPVGIRVEREQVVRMGRRRIVAARAARIGKRAPASQSEPELRTPEPTLSK